MFSRVAVIGPGLLGGSVCKALKKNNSDVVISAFDRSEQDMDRIYEDGNADFIDIIDNFLPSDYQLIVVAVPVVASLKIIKDIITSPELKSGTLIIDVGSVKYEIVKAVSDCDAAGQFIGCHPMAGSEKDGYDNSISDLFKDASVIITPTNANEHRDVQIIEKFWQSFGAVTAVTSPEEHDITVAYTSHLPHLTACSVAGILRKYSKDMDFYKQISPFIGDGFRDVTRISSGSPDVWQDIINLNKKNIENSIYELIYGLQELLRILKNDAVDTSLIFRYLKEIKKFRDGIK